MGRRRMKIMNVGIGGDMSASLEEISTKLDQVLTACGEIAVLKDEIHKLRDEVKFETIFAVFRGRNSTRKPERNSCTSPGAYVRNIPPVGSSC